MKKLLTAVMLLTTVGMSAQETYQNAELMTQDLNGTAAYVGMGGAMDALGGDLSVMGTNPAGIGLFRKSTANVSFGFSHVQNGGNISGADNKTFMNVDQAGFVIAVPSSTGNFVNFGINYRKGHNFNQILAANGILSATSQNKVSYDKQDNGNVGTFIDRYGYINTDGDAGSQVDYLYYNTLLPEIDGKDYMFYYNDASDFIMERDRKGYIGEYDFNLSGNINDRFYLGFTLGVKDVHYKNSTLYTDFLLDSKNNEVGSVTLDDVRRITGTGADLTFGLIFRPIEANPLRIGLTIKTPTYYDLTTENSTYMYNDTPYGVSKNGYSEETYEYVMVTPWQFGFSAGTTFGDYLALGASYDFTDYSSSKSRIKDGTAYDWWTESAYDHTRNDNIMNSHTEKMLKGVSTFKVGAEFYPVPEMAVRLGYNYVSPMYKKNAFRNLSLDSPGTYYSSTTDYTNWKGTSRITCGLGYQLDAFSIDLAYQYSTTKGDFYPFENYDGVNPTFTTNIKNDRHQVICTLGMRF